MCKIKYFIRYVIAMRKILQDMGLRITELSDIMDVSRPTMYKFIDMYENGKRDDIDPVILKFFDSVERNPKMKKKDALYYALLIQGSRRRSDAHDRRVKTMVTVTAVDRPARKLLLLRSKDATDYMNYCEEMGCEWENVLNGIECRFDDAALVTLPKNMVVPQTSKTASGIEVSADFSHDVPNGYEVIDLPSSTMLYFRGSPYVSEDDFCEALEIVFDAIDSYDPEIYGWKFDTESAPSFNFGASSKKGARVAIPVKNLTEVQHK